jgi:hypothetical protein
MYCQGEAQQSRRSHAYHKYGSQIHSFMLLEQALYYISNGFNTLG